MTDNYTMRLVGAFSEYQRLRGFSERTIERRRWSLGKLNDVCPLLDVDRAAIERFAGGYRTAQTRYTVLSDAHMFYRWAMGRGLATSDPTELVDRPRLGRRAPTPLTVEQLRAVLDAANRWQRPAIMLAAHAGLRCSEIAQLDHADVHHDRRALVVRAGKGDKDAVLPLAAALADELPELSAGPVVRYTTGQGVGAAIRRVMRRCGVERRPHDLRHTFGTAAAERSGGDIYKVRSLMRHASIQTTDRYVAWLPAGGDIVDDLYPPAA